MYQGNLGYLLQSNKDGSQHEQIMHVVQLFGWGHGGEDHSNQDVFHELRPYWQRSHISGFPLKPQLLQISRLVMVVYKYWS